MNKLYSIYEALEIAGQKLNYKFNKGTYNLQWKHTDMDFTPALIVKGQKLSTKLYDDKGVDEWIEKYRKCYQCNKCRRHFKSIRDKSKEPQIIEFLNAGRKLDRNARNYIVDKLRKL